MSLKEDSLNLKSDTWGFQGYVYKENITLLTSTQLELFYKIVDNLEACTRNGSWENVEHKFVHVSFGTGALPKLRYYSNGKIEIFSGIFVDPNRWVFDENDCTDEVIQKIKILINHLCMYSSSIYTIYSDMDSADEKIIDKMNDYYPEYNLKNKVT
jgi:hypothetical protein